MKILYINAVCGVGSTGRIVADLMQQAKSQGHEVKVACSSVETIKDIDSKDAIIVGSRFDYYLHNILSRLTDHEGSYSRLATRKLICRIREFDPDIVHIHTIHGHWINYELLFQYLSEEHKKVLWTLHDCWAFTGHCTHFISYTCNQWKNQCKVCKGLKGYPKCYGNGDVYRNYNKKKRVFLSIQEMKLSTPSEWLASIVKQSFFGEKQVIAIPNGIDTELFKPTDSNFRIIHGIENKTMILGVANVWSEKKGLGDIIKLQSYLDETYCIVLVGVTDEQKKRLPKSIISITRTTNIHQLVEIYSTADVFINPSYEETMGLVTVEAMACGTPVVVYDQTAVPEVVDQHSGKIVQAGNIKELYEGIVEVLAESKDTYNQTRERGLLYEKVKRYKEYFKIYDEMAGM